MFADESLFPYFLRIFYIYFGSICHFPGYPKGGTLQVEDVSSDILAFIIYRRTLNHKQDYSHSCRQYAHYQEEQNKLSKCSSFKYVVPTLHIAVARLSFECFSYLQTVIFLREKQSLTFTIPRAFLICFN